MSSKYQLELLADGCGETIIGYADEAIADGDLCHPAASTNNILHVVKADSGSLATMPCLYLSLGDYAAGTKGEFLRRGIVRNTRFFEHAAGTLLYVSATAGADSTTPASLSYIQQVITCLGNSWVDFAPCMVLTPGGWAPT